MVACKLLDLFGLLVDNGGDIREVGIDELLVGFVDKRCDEEDGSREEAQTPDWDDLDQVVGDEGSEEGLAGN